MKKILLSLIMLFALTASAQHKISLSDQVDYLQFKSATQAARAKAFPGDDEAKTTGVIVEMNEGHTVGQLEGKVSRIGFDRGTLGKVYVTLEQLHALDTMPEVKHITFEPTLDINLDRTIPEIKADIVHQGLQDLPQAFTGKGVIIVIYDVGLDPNHPMFLDAEGKSRVKCIITQGEQEGEYKMITDEEAIRNFTTDDTTQVHATHVTGIAAGRCMDDSISLTGMAPDATIVYIPYRQVPYADMCYIVGMLHRQMGAPVVVNMSLGTNGQILNDKHPLIQLLDQTAESDSIIFCIAAGNSGGSKIVQRKTLAGPSDEMKSLVTQYDPFTTDYNYGRVLFEGKGPTPFKLTPVVYNLTENVVVDTIWSTTGSNIEEHLDTISYCIDNDTITISTIVVCEYNEDMDSYQAVLYYSSNYNLELGTPFRVGYIISTFEGNPTTVTAYVTTNYNLGSSGDDSWQQDITYDGTINFLACGHNTISVGSYMGRLITEPTPGFDVYFPEGMAALGDISYYSSWGTVYDGRSFPHFATPGTSVISSINSYSESHNQPENTVYRLTRNGRTYSFAGYSGTSMAAPSATGVIALWLEADPTLTYDKVRSIAMETAVVDDNVRNTLYPVQFGAGKMDALAGLKRVLSDAPTSIQEINARTGRNILIEQTGGRSIHVFAANEPSLQAILYTADGRMVGRFSTAGETLGFTVPSAGMYLVQVIGQRSSAIRKIFVR